MATKKKRSRKSKPINPHPLLAIGDFIQHPRYGIGVVKKIDGGFCPDYEFFYDVDFTGKNGDGTKAWLPKVKTEKMKLEREEP